MPVLDGLSRGSAGQLNVTITTATVAQSFQRNGRAIAADFSMYAVDAPASPGATDKVMQGVLMRADNVPYMSTATPSGTAALPSGIRVRSDRVLYVTESPTAPLRTVFDPLIGQVFIDAAGRLYVDL